MSYINEEVIFDSFTGIENVIVSDVVRAVSYLHSRDINRDRDVHRDIKPANVLVSNSHYKSYKHKELEMAGGKKTIVRKLGNLGKRDLCIHRLTLLIKKFFKNCRTRSVEHVQNLVFYFDASYIITLFRE